MQRTTRQRAAILGLLEVSTQFLSARPIHEELLRHDHPIALATVYRALQALTATKELGTVRAEDGEHLYRRCTQPGPHHLVCRRCGAAVDLPGTPVEDWAGAMARHHGFTQVTPSVELHGVCPNCPAPGVDTADPHAP